MLLHHQGFVYRNSGTERLISDNSGVGMGMTLERIILKRKCLFILGRSSPPLPSLEREYCTLYLSFDKGSIETHSLETNVLVQ